MAAGDWSPWSSIGATPASLTAVWANAGAAEPKMPTIIAAVDQLLIKDVMLSCLSCFAFLLHRTADDPRRH
jgi:hypothetical protein